jgi:hypothetical protein
MIDLFIKDTIVCCGDPVAEKGQGAKWKAIYFKTIHIWQPTQPNTETKLKTFKVVQYEDVITSSS